MLHLLFAWLHTPHTPPGHQPSRIPLSQAMCHVERELNLFHSSLELDIAPSAPTDFYHSSHLPLWRFHFRDSALLHNFLTVVYKTMHRIWATNRLVEMECEEKSCKSSARSHHLSFWLPYFYFLVFRWCTHSQLIVSVCLFLHLTTVATVR